MTQSRIEQDISVMRGLLQTRRTLQSLHGARYAERIQPWVELVREVMAAEQKAPLSAVLALARREDDEFVHLWLMAAGVEVIDQDRGPRSSTFHANRSAGAPEPPSR